MRGFVAVYKREMLSLWVTPLAWVLLFIFLLLQGASFYQILLHFASFSNMTIDSGPVQAYFGQSLFLLLSLLLVCPALTMRLFAEERRSGTIEGLLTAPVSAADVVLGKYLATLTTFGFMWLPTVLYVVILRTTGDVDWHVVGSSYLGVMGVGAGYLAVGTLMSAMSRSQLVAMMLSVLVIFGLLIFGIGERIFEPGAIRDACAHVSVLSQVDELSKGVVDLRRLVFDFSLVALPLFVSVRVVDSWRWG
jgi:gliding motility-associated transport system permease protein